LRERAGVEHIRRRCAERPSERGAVRSPPARPAPRAPRGAADPLPARRLPGARRARRRAASQDRRRRADRGRRGILVKSFDEEAFVGLLALDKPPGPTSHDVVVKVRRRLRSPGAGHLGTLDPAASGLLLVALGAATRAIPVWQGGEKTYEGVAHFGLITSTQDAEGEVIDERPTDTLDEAAVRL